jgi:hypothetical protein
MKSAIQIVALLAVLVGGVFGVTFVMQFTRTNSTATGGGPVTPAIAKELIKCAEKTPEWDKVMSVPGYKSLEIEKGYKGHYDFLVWNLTDQPVKIIREPHANCTCTDLKVLFGVIPDEQGAKLAAAQPPPVGPQLEPYLAAIQWKPLDADATRGPSAPQTLPGSPPGRPQYGVVRFDWEALHIKMTTVKVSIVARQGPAADYVLFEVPITVCPPVIASTDNLALGDINAAEKKDASLVVWSATRDHFDATAKLVVDDPCIQVDPPRLLTKDELKALPGTLLEGGATQSISRAQSAYEIKVTAHERLGENQLELGPLARRVVINRGTESELLITVAGTVRGPIQVGKPPAVDRVDLRVFRAEIGAEKMVEITTSVPGLQLSVDHVKPEEIGVELKEVKTRFGSKQWNLTIVVRPDTVAGPLPPDSAIYLKTNSSPPRRIRIPITGNASG